MKIPEKVNVMGIIYSVVYEDNPAVGNDIAWGLTDWEQAKITLKSGLSDQKQMQTFLHELTHAMIHEMGDDEHSNDERIVNPLGNVLYQVLKDNEIEVS